MGREPDVFLYFCKSKRSQESKRYFFKCFRKFEKLEARVNDIIFSEWEAMAVLIGFILVSKRIFTFIIEKIIP